MHRRWTDRERGEMMAQKNATPTREQQAVLVKNGLRSELWVVVKETQGSLIIKQRITSEFKVIRK